MIIVLANYPQFSVHCSWAGCKRKGPSRPKTDEALLAVKVLAWRRYGNFVFCPKHASWFIGKKHPVRVKPGERRRKHRYPSVRLVPPQGGGEEEEEEKKEEKEQQVAAQAREGFDWQKFAAGESPKERSVPWQGKSPQKMRVRKRGNRLKEK